MQVARNGCAVLVPEGSRFGTYVGHVCCSGLWPREAKSGTCQWPFRRPAAVCSAIPRPFHTVKRLQPHRPLPHRWASTSALLAFWHFTRMYCSVSAGPPTHQSQPQATPRRPVTYAHRARVRAHTHQLRSAAPGSRTCRQTATKSAWARKARVGPHGSSGLHDKTCITHPLMPVNGVASNGCGACIPTCSHVPYKCLHPYVRARLAPRMCMQGSQPPTAAIKPTHAAPLAKLASCDTHRAVLLLGHAQQAVSVVGSLSGLAAGTRVLSGHQAAMTDHVGAKVEPRPVLYGTYHAHTGGVRGSTQGW